VKKLKTAPSSSTEPIYVVPLATTPPTVEVTDRRIIPISEEQEHGEHSAATTEQMDEEIEIDENVSSLLVS
jgi:hypothetical protein